MAERDPAASTELTDDQIARLRRFGRERPLAAGDVLWAAVDRPPLPLETSEPGVFAVGDVWAGSVERVAAAAGEGSTAVQSVHASLATLA